MYGRGRVELCGRDYVNKSDKVLIFGGTFDPVHFGHLRLAEEVSESLAIERVLFVPAGIPPHKNDVKITDPSLRLRMLRAAIADKPAFQVSEVEIKRRGLSYTIETVRELKGEGMELTLVIGADQFNEIRTWCAYEEILKAVDIVVIGRPGYVSKKPGEALPVEVAKKFWYDKEMSRYENSFGHSLTYLNTTELDISASAIRARVGEGLSIEHLVPKVVEDIIVAEGLYKDVGGN